MSSKIISRVSTLDAARTVFFIVVGLAIKQSLGLFSHAWPGLAGAPAWPFLVRSVIGVGYLVTVLRFSHGVTLLYGHEKERIEQSGIPSASKISELSLFLVLLAVPLFLMADNITEFQSYVFWAALMLAMDALYVWRSNVIRQPLRRIFRVLKETDHGYAAHAALWWMATDLILFAACLSFFIPSGLGTWLSQFSAAREIIFAGLLILVAAADYWLNWDFYFGGREDRRKQKFVFVCSPLDNTSPQVFKENIHRAQLYCYWLMEQNGRFAKRITPFASHAFYPYFLNDKVDEDRALGRACALAYLSVCDAVYVYVPPIPADGDSRPKRFAEKLDTKRLSRGMEQEVREAKRFGLELKYLKATDQLPDDWKPKWHGVTFEEKRAEQKSSENYFKGSDQRKKVYVCTPFRGTDFFDESKSWDDKKLQLEENTRLTLWHCYKLVRDTDECIAPFAPQSFFPYFWECFADGQCLDQKWDEWFERSMEVLKVCDAVYIYTTDGLPPTPRNSSRGMQRVDERAQSLGLVIQYRKQLTLPSKEEAEKADREAKAAEVALDMAEQSLARARRKAEVLDDAAADLATKLEATDPEILGARQRAEEARHTAEILMSTVEEAKAEAKKKSEDAVKKVWNPAVPEF